jgi:hypothetical protein
MVFTGNPYYLLVSKFSIIISTFRRVDLCAYESFLDNYEYLGTEKVILDCVCGVGTAVLNSQVLEY